MVHDLNEEGTRRARGVGVYEDAPLFLFLFLSEENRKGKRGEARGLIDASRSYRLPTFPTTL